MQRRNNPGNLPPSQRTLLVRPPDRTFKQKVRDLLWDKKNETCLTRTPVNWFAISLYYFFFCGGVFLVFYISLMIVIAVASSEGQRPEYVLEESPIGTSPGLNFFPIRNSRNLLWLSPTRDYDPYVEIISDTFEAYADTNSTFNTTQFKECSSPPFGYNENAPCIFFRLNRILLWKPKPYKQRDKLPKDMPEKVQNLIRNSATPKIWITCDGTTPKDQDHITQDFFQFQGEEGFDVSSFPYDRQEDYIDSIVALKFKDTNPQRTLYSFTCVAWAKKLNRKRCKVDVTYYIE